MNMDGKTTLLLTVGCEPGNKSCRGCNPRGCRLNPNETDCHACDMQDACAAERAATGDRLRCPACLAAEAAAKALSGPTVTRQGVCGCGRVEWQEAHQTWAHGQMG